MSDDDSAMLRNRAMIVNNLAMLVKNKCGRVVFNCVNIFFIVPFLWTIPIWAVLFPRFFYNITFVDFLAVAIVDSGVLL